MNINKKIQNTFYMINFIPFFMCKKYKKIIKRNNISKVL